MQKLRRINIYKSNNFWDKNIKKSVFILPLHAEKWALIQKQDDWDNILNNVDVFVADGVGLSLGYWFLTGKKIEKISGIDLINQLIEEYPKTPTYIWGTTEDNIKRAAKSYKSQGLNLVGYHDGFTGDDNKIIENIKKSGAKVCFIGMGAKRAAELALRVHRELKITTMTAGGSFDVASGVYKRSPLIIQRIGLEWLWRMVIEPKRFKRFPRLLMFIWYIIKEKYGK